MDKSLQLYSYFRSSCAYRVRIALQIKNLPCELITLHLLKNGGEQNSEHYKRINPSAQVPTLIDGEHIISQSLAILEYLEEKFPQTPLLPKNFIEKSIVRQMCEIVNSGMQPLQNLSVVNYLTNELKISEEEKKSWIQYWVHRGFESLETLLKKHSGQFSFGDRLTLADCCLIPQIFSANRFNVPLTPYPRALKIHDNCMQLPEFIAASPEQQPDYPS